MFLFRAVTLAFVCAALTASCTRRVEQQVVDYQEKKNLKLPEWECHQVYAIKRDSADRASFLEVEAFPENPYPGISMRCLNGDWSGFTSLRIIARTRGSLPVKFFLSVWDGKGIYEKKNRFQKEYMVDTGWSKCILPLENGLVAANGRRINCGYIQRVVFFTLQRGNLTTFDVQRISLQKK
jgi:hypothetical protein